jgi:hypothetical protein
MMGKHARERQWIRSGAHSSDISFVVECYPTGPRHRIFFRGTRAFSRFWSTRRPRRPIRRPMDPRRSPMKRTGKTASFSLLLRKAPRFATQALSTAMVRPNVGGVQHSWVGSVRRGGRIALDRRPASRCHPHVPLEVRRGSQLSRGRSDQLQRPRQLGNHGQPVPLGRLRSRLGSLRPKDVVVRLPERDASRDSRRRARSRCGVPALSHPP